jgi:hypothetical protein
VHLGRQDLRALGAEAAARDGEVAFVATTPDKGIVAHEVAHVLQYRRGTRMGDAEREAESARREIYSGSAIDVGVRPTEPVSFFCSPETPQDCFDEVTLEVFSNLGIDPRGFSYAEAQTLAGMLSRVADLNRQAERGDMPTLLPGESVTWQREAPCTTTMSYRFAAATGELMIESRFDASRSTGGYFHLRFRDASGMMIEREHLEPSTAEHGSCLAPLPPSPEDTARWDEEDRRRARARRERFPAPSAALIGEVITINGLDELDRAMTAVTRAEADLGDTQREQEVRRDLGGAVLDAGERISLSEALDRADELAVAAGYEGRAGVLAARREFLEHFRELAVRVGFTMLERSQNIALDESERYSHLDSGADVSELFDAMSPLRSTVDRITHDERPLGELVTDVVNDALGIREDPRNELLRESATQQWYLRRDYARRFPVIAPSLTPIRTDEDSAMYELASAHTSRSLRRRLLERAIAVSNDVDTARRHLRNDHDLVWQLEGVIAQAKIVAGIAPDSAASRIIDDEIGRHTEHSTAVGLLLAVLAIALGILSGGTGFVAVGATLGSAGLSGYMLMESWRNYEAMTSASGTAIGEESALTSNAPWVGWLVLDVVGLGLDLGAVGMLFARSGQLTSAAIRAARATGEEGEAALRALREEAADAALRNRDLLGTVESDDFVESVVNAARREQARIAAIDPALRTAVADMVPAAVRADALAMDGLTRLPEATRNELIALLVDDPETLRRLGELSELSPPFREALEAGHWREVTEFVEPAPAMFEPLDIPLVPPHAPVSTAADLLDPAVRRALGTRAQEVAASLEAAVGTDGMRAIQDGIHPAVLARASRILTPEQLLEVAGWINLGESHELFERGLGPFVRDAIDAVGGEGLQHILDELDIDGVVHLNRYLHARDIQIILRHARETASATRAQQLVNLIDALDGRSQVLGVALHRADPVTLEAIFEHYPVPTIAREIIASPDQAFNELARRMTAAEGAESNRAWMDALAQTTPPVPASMIGGPVTHGAIRVQIVSGIRQAIPQRLQQIIDLVRSVTAEEATRLRALCQMALSDSPGAALAHLASQGVTAPAKVRNLLHMNVTDSTYRTIFGGALEQLAEARLLASGSPSSWFQVVRFGGRPDILVEMTRDWGFGLHGQFVVLDWTSYADAGHIAGRYDDASVAFKVEILHPGPAG